MRFRISNRIPLTEAEDTKWIDDLRSSKTFDERDEILKTAIKSGLLKATSRRKDAFVSDEYKSIRSVIIDSILRSGVGNENYFLKVIQEAGNKIVPETKENLKTIYHLIDSGLINYGKLPRKLWQSNNLWLMGEEEFEYVLKIFDIASDESKAKLYYDDVSKIDVNELFDPKNSKEIKKSGFRDHAEGTIWDQVEKWADNEKSHFGQDGRGDYRFSINDLFRYKKIAVSSLQDKIRELKKLLEIERMNPTDIDYVVSWLSNKDNERAAKSLFGKQGLDSYEDGELSKFIKAEFKR